MIQLAEWYNASSPFVTIPIDFISILPEGRFDGVLLILFTILGLTVFGGIANFLHQYISAWLAIHVIADVRKQAFKHVLAVPLNHVLKLGSSEFVSRIIRDAEALQVGLLVLLGKSVSQLTKGIVAFLVACVFDIRLVVVAILVLPILALVLRKIGRRVSKGTKASLSAQQELLRISSEAIQGLRAVKVNNAENESLNAFDLENKRVVTAELKVKLMRALGSPLMETLAIIVLGVLAGIAAKSIIDGSMQFDRFLLSIGSLAVAGGSLRPLAGLVTEIQAAEAPATRLMSMLNLPLEEIEEKPILPKHEKSIEFNQVTFYYGNKNQPAISNLSVTIQHGERVAIVGPNGSGKTTMVSMLPRLISPSQGTIKVDGTDIEHVDLTSFRSQLGVVTQETVLFQGTVESNIRFGSDASRAEVIEAAKRAHADEFIQAMDNGYDSVVYEQGKSLSGGQRQRIAIARVLLREPTILIFDEATSQIDAESEALIADTLKQYCTDKTVLVIAHRMSTVQNADRILVLDDGVLIGSGTHGSLLTSCNVYQRLTETQLVPATQDV